MRFKVLIAIFLFTAPAMAEIIPAARKIDWTNAGIPGGIPERTTICATIDAATYGNNSTDATLAINNALAACPSGQVVYLPAGTYIINTYLTMRSNVTLRGAGQGVTTLKAGGTSRSFMVKMTDPNITTEVGSGATTHNITTAVKDAQTVTLDSVSGLTVGDLLLLNQLNDGTEVTNHGMAGGTPTTCTFCGNASGERSLGQFVEITGINGLNVSTNIPLHWTYNAALTPLAYLVTDTYMLRYSGLESLTLTQTSALTTYLLFIQGAQYSWVKDVEISNIASEAILAYYLIQSEISHCYFHTPLGTRQAGTGYGLALAQYSTNNLITDNIADNLSNTGIETHSGASGNVISYNYIHDVYYDASLWITGTPMVNHGAYPKMNLWEGNTAYKAQGDDVWGSSGYQTIFRSQSLGYYTDAYTRGNVAVQFSPLNHYMNVVGNVLGTSAKSSDYESTTTASYSNTKKYIWVLGVSNQGSADDAAVATTLLRHGNYDYVNSDTSWDSGIADHTIPNSLYLSSAPSWWCSETPWPPIGSDLTPMVSKIPAQRRYETLACTTGGETYAGPYYMRADGTAATIAAATGCGAAGTAMSVATFNAATFVPGDIIYMCDDGGSYVAQITFPSSGTSGNPITLTNAPGDTPVIDGQNTRTTGISTNAKDYIVISGIEITDIAQGTGGGIVSTSGSNGPTIENCNIHDTHADAISVNGNAASNTNTIIRYNTITNITANTEGHGNGVFIYQTAPQTVTGAIVEHNTFSNIGTDNHDHCIYDQGVSTIFRFNSCSGSKGFGYKSDTALGGDGAQVYYNLIRDSVSCILINDSSDAPHNIKVWNNTCYQNGTATPFVYGLQYSYTAGTPSGNEFKNNLVVGKAEPEARYYVLVNSDATGLTITNNSYYSAETEVWRIGGANKTWAEWQALKFDTSSLNADPKLDPDLRPLSTSPAIWAGVNVGLTADLDGRTIHNPPSMGAYDGQPAPGFTGLPGSLRMRMRH